MDLVVPVEMIERKIYLIRGHKVLLDGDLAELYGVEVKHLKRQVKRNITRFPEDFMFELRKEEYDSLRSHFGTLKRGEHTKYLPYAFTEQGVAMLSSVLNSERAIHVNIAIMRAFVKLREMLATHKDLARKLDEMEKKYDTQFKVVFDAIRQLMATPEPKKKRIGFIVRERSVQYRTLSRKAVKN
ncbi:MAG: ORF6N domain-containing protein [Nitrospirae bacterium]|nr:ORF6N domain-containing protein [Nitrospirota bacterium]